METDSSRPRRRAGALLAAGLSALLGLAILFPVSPAAAVVLSEGFDAAGSDWSATIFPVLLASGDGTFVRETLGAGLGAPATSPPLPINQGGDKEGRYHEIALAPTTSYALTQGDSLDVTIDGYVAIGYPDPFGSRSVGFVARSTASLPINAYCAIMNHNGGTSATLSLARINNNVISPLVTSQVFTVDLPNENYHVTFTVQGSSLTATLKRVEVSGGAVVENPIDLSGDPGVQDTLSATDSSLQSPGRAGVKAFCRGGNSIFWDDIEVDDEPGGGVQTFVRGDCNADGGYDIADAVWVLTVLFTPGTPPPLCDDACDSNDDGLINIADAVYILANLFTSGPNPPPPFPGCGVDPTLDPLSCAAFPPCP